jgi:predicted nucleotide-binding protein
MARSTSKPAAPLLLPKKVISPDQIERGITRIGERVAELQRFDLGKVPEGPSAELTALSAAIRDTLDRCFGEGTLTFQRFESATILNWSSGISFGDYPQRHHYQEGVQKHIEHAVALLQEAQRTLGEDLADVAHMPLRMSKPAAATKPSNKVFVVHGHDDAAKEGLARFLEKIELEAVILHEQPDQGRTIIEKFEEYAGQVGFAVVLLTPDDLGAVKGNAVQNARARQNVVFELGYFAGKLGRGKTCLLRKGNVEMPSDLYGVIYTELDPAEGWKVKLVKEMKAAGLAFDANKVWD